MCQHAQRWGSTGSSNQWVQSEGSAVTSVPNKYANYFKWIRSAAVSLNAGLVRKVNPADVWWKTWSLCVYLSVLIRNTGATLPLIPSAVIMEWCQRGEKKEGSNKERVEWGGVRGVWTGIPRQVWWFTWATPVTVIATPSAVSTSSHLGCRVIISSVILWRMWKNIK